MLDAEKISASNIFLGYILQIKIYQYAVGAQHVKLLLDIVSDALCVSGETGGGFC